MRREAFRAVVVGEVGIITKLMICFAGSRHKGIAISLANYRKE